MTLTTDQELRIKCIEIATQGTQWVNVRTLQDADRLYKWINATEEAKPIVYLELTEDERRDLAQNH